MLLTKVKDVMDARDLPLISIVVPVLNEEANILPLYEAVCRVMDPVADRYRYEFVFTDNRSSDRTFEILSDLAARDPRVRAFRFSRNFGFQRSIATGYQLARGDAAIQLDCDLQDPPQLILTFLEEWEAGNQIVYGVRAERQEGFIITVVRKLFYRLIDLLSEDHLPHDAGDFRLVDRKVLEQFGAFDDRRPYIRGWLATIGFRQKGVSYSRSARTRGESKFSFRDLVALGLDGVLSHSRIPLRIATYTGIAVSIATFAGTIFYLAGKLIFGNDWPAGFATTTILLLMTLSINALFLGIIGEYLGRIYEQVKRGPLTIVDERVDRARDQQAEVEPIGRSELSAVGHDA